MDEFEDSCAVVFQVQENQVVRIEREYHELWGQCGLWMFALAVRQLSFDEVVPILGRVVIDGESFGGLYSSAEIVLRGHMLEMAQIAVSFDLFDVDEVVADKHDVIKILVSDTGVEDKFADRRTNYGLGQDADDGSCGSGRLERTHHESMTCR